MGDLQEFLQENPIVLDSREHYEVYGLHRNPNVVYGMLNVFVKCPITSAIARTSDEQCYLIVHTQNSLQDVAARNEKWFKRLLISISEFTSKFGRDAFILLCATPQEKVLLESHGIRCVYCSHNAMINDELYDIAESDVIYKSVYNAQFSNFKRHYLAEKCDNLALIYGIWTDRENRFNMMKSILPTAHFLNGYYSDDSSINTFKYFSKQEVCSIYNQSSIGLCLSASEGAMYSSFEYLLCGLPVVSTPALGGRDKLFPPDFTMIVDADPDRIAEAVSLTSAARFDRHEVRRAAISLRDPHRERYVDTVLSVTTFTDEQAATLKKSIFEQFKNTSHGTRFAGITSVLN